MYMQCGLAVIRLSQFTNMTMAYPDKYFSSNFLVVCAFSWTVKKEFDVPCTCTCITIPASRDCLCAISLCNGLPRSLRPHVT